jgi:hypothetical protein
LPTGLPGNRTGRVQGESYGELEGVSFGGTLPIQASTLSGLEPARASHLVTLF